MEHANPKESIANRAALATLSVSYFRGRKRDLAASQGVWASTGSDPGRSEVTKRLLKGPVEVITNIYNRAYQYHRMHTAPWGDGGTRILKASEIFNYTAKMREFESEFWAAVDSMLDRYVEFIDGEQAHLNGLFRIEDYPTLSVLRSRMAWSVCIDPLPEAGDWRIEMGDDQAAELREEYEQNMHRRVAAAMGEAWQSLHQQITTVADILSGGNKKAIKATTFSAVSKLCGLLSELNITDDPKLEEMRRELEATLCHTDADSMAETMRESQGARDEAKAKLDAMVKELGGWMS